MSKKHRIVPGIGINTETTIAAYTENMETSL